MANRRNAKTATKPIDSIHAPATSMGESVKDIKSTKADKATVTEGTAGTTVQVPYVNVTFQGVVSG